jgi:transcription-repair coupling factor (superfamily II helicase)
LSTFAKALGAPGRVTVAWAPPGRDAALLAEAAFEGDRGILHICQDDARLARMASALAFFAPDMAVLTFPAWDCLPYDRVSPNSELVARRLDTLSILAARPAAPYVVLTTVSAVLQRVPPHAFFKDAVLRARPGEDLPQDRLNAYFTANGYQRTGTVREAGEYAVRGGIIDVFPPGTADPLRLDFFGDELESIRRFDAMTQRSLGDAPEIALLPVSEIPFDEDGRQRFRNGYREMFGAVDDSDPLYEAVSAGHRHAGLEHWLPLFHAELESLFDYLPGAAITLDHQVDAAVAARHELIEDYYQARREMLPASRRLAASDAGPVYHPVPADSLYLLEKEWQALLKARAVAGLTPFDAPGGTATRIDGGARPGRNFSEERARADSNPFDSVRDLVVSETKRMVLVAAHSDGSRDRLGTLLREHGLENQENAETWHAALSGTPGSLRVATLDIDRGYSTEQAVVVSEQDILGERLARPPRKRRRAEQFISEISALSLGDLVVHMENGIGRYDGLETLTVGGAPHDCLRLIYAGNDRLYVPVENLDVLARYSSDESDAQLDRLGAPAWQARKARVKERIRQIAGELLKTAAEREMRKGETMPPPATIFDEFCARFAWTETDDQQQAIDDVVADLESGRAMDRLICGDVGFGKTEVAIRAAFVAAMNGYQVAIVVPTTLLAMQHYKTFVDRFAGSPLRIEQLSRLVPNAAAEKIRQGLTDGSVNIVIGTQTLLAKSIAFDNLGLLVVDEEQHFGVAQKERLKALKTNVHVLTLTATPIPRTLQMALAGVREMSIIASPPVDRLAVRTFVLPYDPVAIREAIMREHFRGGQVYYVCPRIADLNLVLERLGKLVPEVKIAVAHGQMATQTLESVMTGFGQGEYDILLATNIIEAGLDIPTANTMIVHRADRFGLAQLYQLRGRIGRSKIRAYAYLTLPPGQALTESAEKRLTVMQALDTLGAGFTLASHDLDIRGAGNLLGEEQSGHIKEVGVELYQQLLEEEIAKQRDGPEAHARDAGWSPQITIGMSVLIPERYVQDLSVRLGLYRRLAHLETRADLDAFAAELVDRFGSLPTEVENLLEIIEIKQFCRAAGIEKVDAGPKGAAISFRNNSFAYPEGLIGYIQQQAGTMRLRPDHSIVKMARWETPSDRVTGVRDLVRRMAEIAAKAG